jgi:hypothetical protein
VPTRKAKDIKKALLKKGFRKEAKHHEMFWFYADGMKTAIRTRFSHGAKECGSFLQGEIRKQMGLENPREFDEFIDCQMTEKAYLELLVDRGRIEIDDSETPENEPGKRKRRRK